MLAVSFFVSTNRSAIAKPASFPPVLLCHAKHIPNNNADLSCFRWAYLCLDLVFTLEHVVNLLQVVGTGDDGGGLALGGVVLLEVGLVTEIAHLQTESGQ